MSARLALSQTLARHWHDAQPGLKRAVVIVGVLAAASGLGLAVAFLPARFSPFFLLVGAAAPLAVVMLSLLVARQEWMPIIILAAAAFSPVTLPTGTGSRLTDGFLLTILFTGLWFLRMIAVERRFWLVPTPINPPLLIFMGVTLWSIVWSIMFRDPLVEVTTAFLAVQLASGLVNIMLPAALLLVANYIKDERLLKVLVGMMLAAGVGGLVVRYELVHFSTDIVNVGGLFNMWVTALAAGLALFCTKWKWYWRILPAGLAGLYVFWGIVLHLSWLAGWLPGLAALGVLVWRHSRRLLLLALVSGVVVVYLKWDTINTAFSAEDTESGTTRLAAWEVNWTITRDHLLFGTGPAGYAAYYMSYFPNNAMATHSNYIDIVAQNGILGFVPCVIFFFVMAWTGWRLTVRLRGRGNFVEALANAGFAGTVACIVAMGFGDWLFPFAYTQTIGGFDYAVYSWLFMGSVLALERLTRPPTRALAHA